MPNNVIDGVILSNRARTEQALSLTMIIKEDVEGLRDEVLLIKGDTYNIYEDTILIKDQAREYRDQAQTAARLTVRGIQVLGRLPSTDWLPEEPKEGDAYVIEEDGEDVIYVYANKIWESFNIGAGAEWGQVSGNIALQGDLMNIFSQKADKTYVDDKASLSSVTSVAGLKEFNTNLLKDGDVVNVISYHGDGNGGGGEFYWAADSEENDNGGTIIQVTGVTTGRFKRSVKTIDPVDFGAKGDGQTNDFDSFNRASQESNDKELPIICSKRKYKIEGSTSLTFKESIDFNYSTLDLNSYTGTIHIRRKKEKVTYEVGSPVVDALNNMTTEEASKGTNNVGGWSDIEDIWNCFIKINTSQDFYTYRGNVEKRIEYNKTYRYGELSSPFLYNLPVGDITSVEAYPMEDKFTRIKNVTIDLQSHNSPNSIIQIASSHVRVEGFIFLSNPNELTSSPYYITIRDSCDVKIEGVINDWATKTRGDSAPYLLNYAYSYDLTFKDIESTGDGWGQTGGNLCQRVTFDNCKLNRIDFHRPGLEWVKIKDCVIGDRNIGLSIIGDLYIEGCKHIKQLGDGTIGYISGRRDVGGFADGNLFIERSTFINKSGSMVNLIQHEYDSGADKPVGSPINYRFFKRITYNDCKLEQGSINVMPAIKTSSDVSYPEYIRVRNFDVNGNCRIQRTLANPKNVSSATNPIDDDFNLTIDIENLNNVHRAEIIDATGEFNVKTIFNSVNITAGSFELNYKGKTILNDVVCNNMDFNSPTGFEHHVSLNELINKGDILIGADVSGVCVNSKFLTSSTFNRSRLARFRMINSGRHRISENVGGTTGIIAFETNVPVIGQELFILMLSTDYENLYFRFPQVGANFSLFTGDGSLIVLKRISSTQIEVVSNASGNSLERIYLY